MVDASPSSESGGSPASRAPMTKWIRKEILLVFMLITAYICLRFPLPFSAASVMYKASASDSPTDGYFTVDRQRIYCRQHKPTVESTGVTVVLLHGQAFTSETWEEIGTLSHLAAQGITAFALDLPGYGMSADAEVSDKGEFLKAVMDYVKGSVKIVVSPSMSGSFAIPYINKYGDEIDGYVPVAPVGLSSLAPPESVLKTLPVLAVAGEMDTGGVGTVAVFTRSFDHTQQLIIPHGSHPAYLDDPELFNRELSEFALSLK